MAVQLGLHQRLSIVLGHPTTTLALVIATMLLGTGVGSALAGLMADRVPPAVLLTVPIVAVAGVSAGFHWIPRLGELSSRLGVAIGGLELQPFGRHVAECEASGARDEQRP